MKKPRANVLSLAVATLVALAGCGGGSSAQGTERGSCYPNGTCNTGLVCLSNVCVVPSGDAAVAETSVSDASDGAANDVAIADAQSADAPALDATTSDAVGSTDSGTVDANGPDVTLRDDAGLACPSATIFHPGTETRAVNTSVPFIGRGRTPTCDVLTDGALVWTDSLEGQIGTGETFNYTFTMVGTHTVTLTATYTGGTATDTVTFMIQ